MLVANPINTIAIANASFEVNINKISVAIAITATATASALTPCFATFCTKYKVINRDAPNTKNKISCLDP